jgi:hypothetical protein
MKDKIDGEPVGKTLTENYNLIWGDWLNWCMVDYDIIHILKDFVGYSSWSNFPIKQREL